MSAFQGSSLAQKSLKFCKNVLGSSYSVDFRQEIAFNNLVRSNITRIYDSFKQLYRDSVKL